MYRYKSHYERQKEAQRQKMAGVVGWTLAVIAVVAVIVLTISDNITKNEIVERLKQKHADEMAQCLTDWKAGKNGGCNWEIVENREGDDFFPVGVEVVAKPTE